MLFQNKNKICALLVTDVHSHWKNLEKLEQTLKNDFKHKK